MRKLALGIAATAAVYGAFWLHPQQPPPALDWRDDMWIGLVAGTFALAALVMLLSRAPWTWRAVGLFLTSLGAAALYGAILWTRRDGNPSPAIPETWGDMIRALYIVGGPLLLIGLLDFLATSWRERRLPERPHAPSPLTTPPATLFPRRRPSEWEDA